MSELVDRNKFMERTPDGEWTRDVDEYLASWKAISEQLSKKLDLVCIGFNPGFLMKDALEPNNRSIDIPVWLAKRIVEAKP